jgi:hypothetical protein
MWNVNRLLMVVILVQADGVNSQRPRSWFRSEIMYEKQSSKKIAPNLQRHSVTLHGGCRSIIAPAIADGIILWCCCPRVSVKLQRCSRSTIRTDSEQADVSFTQALVQRAHSVVRLKSSLLWHERPKSDL